MSETSAKDYVDLLNPRFLKREFDLKWWQVILIYPWSFLLVLMISIMLIVLYCAILVILICLIPFIPIVLILHALLPENTEQSTKEKHSEEIEEA